MAVTLWPAWGRMEEQRKIGRSQIFGEERLRQREAAHAGKHEACPSE